MGGHLQPILDLRPGEVHRTASGFFQRLPNDSIAFLPSIFRLPWHAKTPRLVDIGEIRTLLRAETIELLSGIAMLILAAHYFFTDILRFYLDIMSLALAVVAHAFSIALTVALILYLNNAPFALLRQYKVRHRPYAPKSLTSDDLDRWRAQRKLWLLSVMSNEAAANLSRSGAVLHIVLFFCSLPLLMLITGYMLLAAPPGGIEESFGVGLAVYAALSLWGFLESSLVLRQQIKAGRRRHALRQQT
jgi:hypothetical protein